MINTFKKFIKNRLLADSFFLTRLPEKEPNTILLTFDDGPHPHITPKVLKMLAQYDARAIFFIPGRRIERAPYLLPEILAGGHIIGNHSYIHSNGKQPLFFDYWRDLLKCQKMIENYCGITPKFFRPPCGVISSTTLLTSKLARMKMITWSIDVHDWRCKNQQEASKSAIDLIETVTPGDIVLLHDDNPCVVDILKTVLPIFKGNGLDLANGVKSFC